MRLNRRLPTLKAHKFGFERGVRMKGKQFILCVALAFLAGLLVYSAIQRKHTFTLSNEDGGVKAEYVRRYLCVDENSTFRMRNYP